ncbi:hypothetical protein [Pseudomonas chlororaphis]|uniref:hypothetical protein n=1 Tax=Pseudomonas chlororaphis TaxID=587753 RepID=UPI0023684C72|nr:hypothetical protein [Pseudomonas chlororaphis]WDG47205.1 hypothetical protein PUP58_26240 [Pseudomonas chlororaphis]
MAERCLGFLCFIPVASGDTKFFGFSEFLAGLALMVLAWTIADVSYKFRVATAPVPLRRLTFYTVSIVGLLTLLTDLWRAEGWLVPKGTLFTPSTWQTFLGLIFLITFLSWAWYAFIRPPIFGRSSAKHFAHAIYHFVLKGAPAELAVVAEELRRSAKNIVKYSVNGTESAGAVTAIKSVFGGATASSYAEDILMLISERRFCKAVVESSPGTALEIYLAVREAKKYSISIDVFSKNIINCALVNKDSFLYQESGGYNSGLIGHFKPLSHAMFSQHEMVEKIGSMFELDLWGGNTFDSSQWEAYCRIVLITYKDKVNNDFWGSSRSLWHAFDNIERAVADLYKLNGVVDYSINDDSVKKLRVVVEFVKEVVSTLEKLGVPEYLTLKKDGAIGNHYDQIANLIFEIVQSSAAVKAPWGLAWWIHHNTLWGEVFGAFSSKGPVAKIIMFKFRRLVYEEFKRMKQYPNFKGAKFAGFFLNIFGFLPNKKATGPHEEIIRRIVVGWLKGFYVDLYRKNPQVAAHCLVDGIVYDDLRLRLIKTYSTNALRPKPKMVYLQLAA